jgi:ribosomal small subunit protein bTHX
MEDALGKGDARSRRGKIFAGSYGKTRKHSPPTGSQAATPSTTAAKKPRAKQP